MNGWEDAWTDGKMYVCLNGWLDEWVDGWANRQIHDAWERKWADGWKEGWLVDRQMDRYIHRCMLMDLSKVSDLLIPRIKGSEESTILQACMTSCTQFSHNKKIPHTF